jgi:hypothetical protein
MKRILILAHGFVLILGLLPGMKPQQAVKAGDAALGTRKYEDFQTPRFCGTSCHTDFFEQWKQAMMSQAYTHHWDEIEYFKLAVPQAEKDAMVAGVKAGCNGCHAPIAFLAGDVPPPLPSANSRANEAVSCDFCHTITGFEGDTPYNYNWISEPGKTKYGPRGGKNSPEHDLVKPNSWAKPSSAAPVITRRAPTTLGSSRLTLNGKTARTPPRASSATTAT